MKRESTFQLPDLEPIEISSDEEAPPEHQAKKTNNCIASRTRSKDHQEPSPNKRQKHSTHSSSHSSADGSSDHHQHTTKLGSNIRKTSNRQHHGDTGGHHSSTITSANLRRTPINITATTSNTSTDSLNQSNNNVNNSHLRRSSRSKVKQSTSTTGSCISSAASSSQACTSSASPGTYKRQSLHMANDGSRDTTSTHHQSQNHYGKTGKQFTIKLHRLTFNTAVSNSSSFLQLTTAGQSTDMPNIHSLRRSPRGSVKTNSLSTSATVHASPLATNASTSAISIASTR